MSTFAFPSPLDTILPAAPYRELHHRVIPASIEDVWPHCLGVSAREIRMLGPLMAFRTLPARIGGRAAKSATAPRPVLDVFTDEGFVLLRRDSEPLNGRVSIVFGGAGRFWSIRNDASVTFPSADAFIDFDEPGYAKTVARLDAVDLGDGSTRIETETLVAGTDPASTRRFRPYWAGDPAAERLDPAQLARSDRSAGLPVTIRDLIPRRATGLPPGQRQMNAFPRFADDPLRPAPPNAPIALTVSIGGDPIRTFSADDLGRLEQVEQVSDFHCVTTWTYRNAHWGGVRFGELARAVFGGSTPPYLVAHAADEMSAIYDAEDLDNDNVLLATRLDGCPLDQRHGAPLRLVSPDQYGYKNIKHLVGLDFRHEEPSSTMGAKEHLRARVADEERHSTLPNWAVTIPYRLLIIPTALVAERTLRSSPR